MYVMPCIFTIVFGVYMTLLFKDVLALSNRGKQFYLGFPENRILAEYPVVRLYMTSLSTSPVQVIIRMPFITNIESLNNGITRTIQPGRTLVEEYSYELHTEGTAFSNKGMIVESDSDITIQVGQLNDLSSDTYLAFPTNSLGTEYHALTFIYQRESSYTQGPTQILLVGISEETQVTIRLPDVVTDTLNALLNLGVKCINSICTTTLLWCQTLQIQSKQDLTGTYITTDKPLSAFAGTVWSSIKTEYMGDHMVEQIPPSNTWGGEFILLPIVNRTSGDMVRVLAKENDTSVILKIYLSSDLTAHSKDLDERKYFDIEMPSSSYMNIISTKAILVAQFSMSNGADDFRLGDPFMSYIPPMAQYSTSISVADMGSLFKPFYNSIALISNTSDINNIYINDKSANTFTHQDWIEVPFTKFKINTIFLPYQEDVKFSNYYKITTTESGAVIGGLLYGQKVQESFGNVLGQEMNRLDIKCYNVTMNWEDAFDNDCDGQVDEEIANGIDDDNDGIVDEDVFNEKMNRQQHIKLMKEKLQSMTTTEMYTMTSDTQRNNSGQNNIYGNTDEKSGRTKNQQSYTLKASSINDGFNNNNENTLTRLLYHTISLGSTIDANGRNGVTDETVSNTRSEDSGLTSDSNNTSTGDQNINNIRNTTTIINTLDPDLQNNKETLNSGVRRLPVTNIPDAHTATTKYNNNLNNNIVSTTVSDNNDGINMKTSSHENSSGFLSKFTTKSSHYNPENGSNTASNQKSTGSDLQNMYKYTISTSNKGNMDTNVSIHNNSSTYNSNFGLNTITAQTHIKGSDSDRNTYDSSEEDFTTQNIYTLSGSTEDISYFDNLLIIIPVSVLFGLPFLCCLYTITKSMIVGCKNRKTNPESSVDEIQKENNIIKENTVTKLSTNKLSDINSHNTRTGLYIDCRDNSSKPIKYNLSDYSKTRMFTSSQCKQLMEKEIKTTNSKSLKRIRAEKLRKNQKLAK